MSWFAFTYNKVSDTVTETAVMGDMDPIPDSMFASALINGELELYYAQVYSNGGTKWCMWNKKHKQWFFADLLPDMVKLTRMMLE